MPFYFYVMTGETGERLVQPLGEMIKGSLLVYINETLVDAANNLSPDDRPEGFVYKGSGLLVDLYVLQLNVWQLL